MSVSPPKSSPVSSGSIVMFVSLSSLVTGSSGASSEIHWHPSGGAEHSKPGGQLIKQTHKFFGSKEHYCGVRGVDIGNILFEEAQKRGAEILLDATVIGIYRNDNFKISVGIVKDEKFSEIQTNGVIVTTGASENMLAFPNNDG